MGPTPLFRRCRRPNNNRPPSLQFLRKRKIKIVRDYKEKASHYWEAFLCSPIPTQTPRHSGEVRNPVPENRDPRRGTICS